MEAINVAPIKPAISIQELSKLDIRVGTITSVDDVPSSDKLVSLAIDLGDHTRRVLVGMKGEREDPKEIEGMQALFVVNLEPKTMAGQPSEGMLLDVGYEDGIVPALLRPERSVPNGARAG